MTSGSLVLAADAGGCVQTVLGALEDLQECPLPEAYPGGECDVLLRADDIVHDDLSPVKARIERKAFRGSEFLYTLRLASGEQLMAHVPSHHDHAPGEWIGIRPRVEHVVTDATDLDRLPGLRNARHQQLRAAAAQMAQQQMEQAQQALEQLQQQLGQQQPDGEPDARRSEQGSAMQQLRSQQMGTITGG